MNRPLPNLTVTQLRYVREAATAPTLTVAAARLGVTQSALTQGLAEVERRLGVALFDRSGRTRRPTAVLPDVLAVAAQVLAAVDDLTARLDELATGQRGTLRVGMIDTAALDRGAAPLAAFRAAHPDVAVTLVVEGSVGLSYRVADGELDLAVVVSPNTAIDLQYVEARPWYDEPLRIYPAHPGSGPQGWGPWVTYPQGSQTRRLIEAALARRGLEMDVVAESSNPDVLRQMVHLGVGSCVLPVAVAERGPVPLQPAENEPLISRSLAVIRRREALANPARDTFAALLTPAVEP